MAVHGREQYCLLKYVSYNVECPAEKLYAVTIQKAIGNWHCSVANGFWIYQQILSSVITVGIY